MNLLKKVNQIYLYSTKRYDVTGLTATRVYTSEYVQKMHKRCWCIFVFSYKFSFVITDARPKAGNDKNTSAKLKDK